MSRRRTSDQLRVTTDFGTAYIQVATEDNAAWTLWVNEVPSSSHHRHEPTRLDFPYLATLSNVVRAYFPDQQQRLHLLHLGGAACALPRALAAHYPQSRHLVSEIDPKLIEFVRTHFDLPRSPVLKIRAEDALSVLTSRRPGSSQVIIRDVFSGATTPKHLIGTEFMTAAKTCLTDDGVLGVNVAVNNSLPGLRAELHAAAQVFDQVGVLAEHGILRGKRSGNVVLVAATRTAPQNALQQICRRLDAPSRYLNNNEARAFADGASLR